MKRRGKIARLPREIRQELNERLHEDEVAASLGEWLNALPAVQAILKAEFAGAPISEQNISEWRKGGYEEWVQRENALEVAVRLGERAQELEADDLPSITESLVFWLMARLLVGTRELDKMEWEKQWPLVTKMCANLAKLRRIQKEAKKERQGREDARPQKRKAMAIAEEEVEEWDEALEEEKAELARREAQAAAARPPTNPHHSQSPPRRVEKAVPAAIVAEPGKATFAAQVEKMGKAIQDMRAAQVARAVLIVKEQHRWHKSYGRPWLRRGPLGRAQRLRLIRNRP